MGMEVESLIAPVRTEVVEWRRHLHSRPELSFQEAETAQFVQKRLESFGSLEISRPTRTSVVARLSGAAPGRTVVLRADMDALAVQEENEVEYASRTPGVMHACGHDGHTAMLLGAAKVLTRLRERLRGEVRFIFQHAEEMPPGGARELVAAGVVEGVGAVVGLHLTNDLPVGKIGLETGAILANADSFDVVIRGKGGHGSRPETAIDPIVIGAQVITNLQQIVSRNLSALDSVVISVTQFLGGTTHNIIPQTASLCGTVRSFDPKIREEVVRLLERTIRGIVEAHGATYSFDYRRGYGAVVNDPELTAEVETVGVSLFGRENVVRFPRRMAGEDFSAYLRDAPGCFAFIGAANARKGLTYSNHHPRFDIDEDALDAGLKLNVYAALRLTGSE
jgi:amidohydrolase